MKERKKNLKQNALKRKKLIQSIQKKIIIF